jgi:hypothetical protein
MNRKSVAFNEDVLVLLIPSRKYSKILFSLVKKECEMGKSYNYTKEFNFEILYKYFS